MRAGQCLRLLDVTWSSLQRDSKRVASLWTSVVTSVFVDILKLSHSTVVLCSVYRDGPGLASIISVLKEILTITFSL